MSWSSGLLGKTGHLDIDKGRGKYVTNLAEADGVVGLFDAY